MSLLQEIQESVVAVSERVGRSVVGLGRGRAFGTGIVVGEGRVLTNAHVLRREEVSVGFADGRRATGRVAGVDVDGDLAVIAVDTGDAPAIEWSDSSAGLGAPVFALANPAGRGMRVTFGLVCATERTFRGPRGRRITGSIEHSAPLPRGSSGGPLVDVSGRLLGINTLRLEGGLIVALAADAELRSRTEALGRGESPRRVSLGISIAPPHAARRMRRAVGLPERDGALVRGVIDGSPAAAAGIQRGDLIVSVGGTAIVRLDDLYRTLDSAAGETLELTLVRGAEERTVSVRPVPEGE